MKEWTEERKNARHFELKAEHPDWSEEQIWTQISIEIAATEEIDNAGPDIDPLNIDLIKTVLDKARTWLKNVLPDVFVKVSSFFEKLILTVGDWIGKGLSFVIEAIGKLLGK